MSFTWGFFLGMIAMGLIVIAIIWLTGGYDEPMDVEQNWKEFASVDPANFMAPEPSIDPETHESMEKRAMGEKS